MATFLAFPVGGLPAIALGGVDSVASAAAGGVSAGFIIGAAQGLTLRHLGRRLLATWTILSGLGLGIGLAAGAALVDYGTTGSDLILQGVVSGLGIGLAQAAALRGPLGLREAGLWAASVTVLWPLGWTVTRAAGVSVEDQFAVFGATGALVFTAASGALLLLRRGARS